MKEVTIDGVVFREYVAPDVSRYSMIRTNRAGVHYGIIRSREGMEITLTDARRIWSWTGGANTLNELSQTGPTSARVSVPVNEITLLDAIEIIPMSEFAVKKLGAMKWN